MAAAAEEEEKGERERGESFSFHARMPLGVLTPPEGGGGGERRARRRHTGKAAASPWAVGGSEVDMHMEKLERHGEAIVISIKLRP